MGVCVSYTCYIYRFGLVTGDTKKGRYDTDQWLFRLLSSCIELGRYPVDFLSIGLLPVDVAVKALVFLAQQSLLMNDHDRGNRQQTIFHPENPDSTEIAKFFETFNRVYPDDTPLKALPTKQWLQVIKAFAEGHDSGVKENSHDKDLSIYPLMLDAVRVNDGEHHSSPDKITKVNSDITRRLLQQGGLHFPEVDQHLMKIYLRSVVQSLRVTLSSSIHTTIVEGTEV